MARALSTELTDAQRRIARAIARFERNLQPVFVTALLATLRLARSSSLMPTLRKMERNGYVEIHGTGRGHAAVVRLTPRGRFAMGLGGVPLLGAITAGRLEEAIADAESILDESELLASRPGDFLLRVKGDSMTGDGILPGDKVLLRPDIQMENGEIAAVLVGAEHEATLKHVFFELGKAKATLRASNPSYKDINVKVEELKIAGVYRGLVRDAHSTSHRK